MQQIFLLDNNTGDYAEIEVEDNVLELQFQISEIENIDNRKDSISKQIEIKSTPKNDIAFGNLFNLNRSTSASIINSLMTNYQPLRKVDCVVYDDGLLILKGYLVVTSWKVTKNSIVVYQATIQGSSAGLKGLIGDKLMTDLDLSDMTHTYSALAIVDSWGGKTTGANSIGNSRTYWRYPSNVSYTKPFELGVGYVYGLIDYGEKFVYDRYNVDYSLVKLQNFRPQVYAKEFLNRILADVGYTFEVKGSPSFKEKFNRLIVPDTTTDLFSKDKGVKVRMNKTTLSSFNGYYSLGNRYTVGSPLVYYPNENQYVLPIQFDSIQNIDYNLIKIGDRFPWQNTFNGVNTGATSTRDNNLFFVTRDFKTSVKCFANINVVNQSPTSATESYSLQLVKRKGDVQSGNDDESYGEFEVIAEKQMIVPYGSSFIQGVTLDVEGVEFFRGEEFMFRIKMSSTSNIALYVTSGTYFQLGKDANAEVLKTAKLGDLIVPKAPMDLKQFDFFKSLLLMMNMYCYTNKDNPKHLYLQTYDDYYATSSPLLLPTTAIDISRRIDLSKGLEVKTNINLPKSYAFTYADDGDYLNERYKSLHNEAYGSKKFSDSYGTGSEKKIELVFAPTPPAMIDNVDRLMSFFTAEEVSLLGKKKMNVKPRILFYSGVYGCNQYTISDELWNLGGNNWLPSTAISTRFYPVCSSYLFRSDEDIHNTPFNTNGIPKILVPVDDLMFGKPKTYFFQPTTNYLNLSANGYSNYYINQVSELTNPNLITLTASVVFEANMIHNLDLSQPVFIELEGKGYGYFKIITLEYGGQNIPSKVTLLKIN